MDYIRSHWWRLRSPAGDYNLYLHFLINLKRNQAEFNKQRKTARTKEEKEKLAQISDRIQYLKNDLKRKRGDLVTWKLSFENEFNRSSTSRERKAALKELVNSVNTYLDKIKGKKSMKEDLAKEDKKLAEIRKSIENGTYCPDITPKPWTQRDKLIGSFLKLGIVLIYIFWVVGFGMFLSNILAIKSPSFSAISLTLGILILIITSYSGLALFKLIRRLKQKYDFLYFKEY